MIDALLYAVRDGIRAAGLGYGHAECDITADGRPAPRCGSYYAAVHGGKSRGQADNQLFELFEFSVTLTMRVTVPLDRVGDQQIALNIARIPLGERRGFNAKVDRLKDLLHMNWGIVVLTGRTPPSANDNLSAWATGSVYGFCEPMRYLSGADQPTMVGGEWFASEPDAQDVGIKATLQFGKCKRFQPQTLANGPFV